MLEMPKKTPESCPATAHVAALLRMSQPPPHDRKNQSPSMYQMQLFPYFSRIQENCSLFIHCDVLPCSFCLETTGKAHRRAIPLKMYLLVSLLFDYMYFICRIHCI